VTTPNLVEREAIALHEAHHAVAATEMGLTVRFIDINGFSLGVAEFVAGVGIVAPTPTPEGANVLPMAVAVIAPSLTVTGDEQVDRYARLEREAGLALAGSNGIEAGEVIETAEYIVWKEWDEIRMLANRLAEEGRIEFARLTAEAGA